MYSTATGPFEARCWYGAGGNAPPVKAKPLPPSDKLSPMTTMLVMGAANATGELSVPMQVRTSRSRLVIRKFLEQTMEPNGWELITTGSGACQNQGSPGI